MSEVWSGVDTFSWLGQNYQTASPTSIRPTSLRGIKTEALSMSELQRKAHHNTKIELA